MVVVAFMLNRRAKEPDMTSIRSGQIDKMRFDTSTRQNDHRTLIAKNKEVGQNQVYLRAYKKFGRGWNENNSNDIPPSNNKF